MNRLLARLAPLALAAVTGAALAADPKPGAQAAPAPSDAPYQEGTVWNLTFVRTVAGMGDDYLKSLSTTWRRTMDEAKKQGVVVSYKILSMPATRPDDWDLLLMVEYRSWAALDGLDAKLRAIEARIIGGQDQMRTLMTKRLEIRQILGEKTGQELILK
ncbi:MAG TPA: hypothetical protein VIW03_16450 [Anaeromyxobacter sp.]